MSLVDQFEVKFNELTNNDYVEAGLDEIQPVELAGVLQQEISRIQMSIDKNDSIESINLFLSNHDYKRLLNVQSLIMEGLNEFIAKSVELKRYENLSNTQVVIKNDSKLDKGIVKSVPIVVNTETLIETSIQKLFVIEINGLRKDLSEGSYTVGRGTEVDIQIQDPGISRKHLVIEVAEKVLIKDLNSTNGTFYKEERISELVVEDEIIFRVGVTELKITSEIR
jgi:hypothetical protein